MTTDDGLTLEADIHVARKEGPAVALFHMIPPSNDRSNYPPEFIEALTAEGFNVLNVDRRGAGRSEGVAREAYRGPKGALDVAAAVDFLRRHACRFDLTRLTLVGASNGTTSILDYAAAPGERPKPTALVFLTGGRYTEAQHKLQKTRDLLPRTLFVWGRGEGPARTWAEGHRAGAPAHWSFQEYPSGAHGTRLFRKSPKSIPSIASWIGSP